MEDDSVGAKPYERLDAQLLLDSIAFGRLAVDQASMTPPDGAAPVPPPAPGPPPPANPRRPRRPVFVLSEETIFRLPPLVRQKTDKGRKMADFLTAVVKGELSGFRPHHWIRAAKHLAARAYSREIDPDPPLPGLSVQGTRALIDKLIADFQERKLEAAAQPAPDAAMDRVDDGDVELDSPAPAHPAPPRDGYAAPCPDGTHIFRCECAEENRELRQLVLDHFRQSPDHPP